MHRRDSQGFIHLPLFLGTVIIGTLFSSATLVLGQHLEAPEAQAVQLQAETILQIPTPPPNIKETLQIPSPTPELTPPSVSLDKTTITNVIDPITYEVLFNGKTDRVRLIGVRLPFETCFKVEEFVKKDDALYIVSDPVLSDRDPEGNLYRYAFLADNSLLNEKLLSLGQVQTFNFLNTPYLYEQDFNAAQSEAQQTPMGVWENACSLEKATEADIQTSPSPSPSLTPSATPTPISSPPLTSLVETAIDQTIPTKQLKTEVRNRIADLASNVRSIKNEASPKPSASTVITIIQSSPKPSAAFSLAIPASDGPTLNSELIFTLINEHRTNIGKPAFAKDATICSIAESRTPELFDEIFVTHTMHAGFFARNLPYWATENVAHFNSEAIIVNWWLNSPVHRRAIEGDYTHSCGACLGHSCSQIFTSFVEK